MPIENELFVTLDSLAIEIKDLLNALPNFNILTDDLENKLLNQENIIVNKILEVRPDADYRNDNMTKSSIGLGDVSNDAQVRLADKASVLESASGSNDTKWMTPYKTQQAISQYLIEENVAGSSTIEKLQQSWLYGGF